MCFLMYVNDTISFFQKKSKILLFFDDNSFVGTIIVRNSKNEKKLDQVLLWVVERDVE